MAATVVRAFFLAVFASWVGGELWIRRAHRLPADAPGRDRGSMALLVASVWVAVVLGIAAAALLPGAAIGAATSKLLLLGSVLMLAGMALRWCAIITLGPAFTVKVGVRPAQPIVERGPYRWVRHPSYAGSLITILGLLVCCGNFVSLAFLVLPIAGHAYRIRVEEGAMVDVLGDEYSDYMRRTKRLVPLVL